MAETVYTVVVVEAGVITSVETYADRETAGDATAESRRQVNQTEDDVGLFVTEVRP